MKKVCILCSDNATLTSLNFSIFEKAFLNSGWSVVKQTQLKKTQLKTDDVNNCDLFLVPLGLDAIRLIIKRKKIILWVQGVLPEECKMRGKNLLVCKIASLIEKIGIKKAAYIWVVSEHMCEHYEKKYKCTIHEKTSVFPCFNTELQEDAFLYPHKYENKVFTYAGGIKVWECFDKILDIYKEIEKKHEDAYLLLFVKEKEKVEQMIVEKGIRNYSIDYVPPLELSNRLFPAKFGFIIRDNDTVNLVSTPTKISTYLSCGVIPIYTDTIGDFGQIANGMEYAVCQNCDSYETSLEKLLSAKIEPNAVLSEYKGIFSDYYSKEKYISDIEKVINQRII